MKKVFPFLIYFFLIFNFTIKANNGLIVHYKLDETSGSFVSDSSGNGYNASVNGSPNWVPGRIGGAFEFDGNTFLLLPAGDLGLTSDSGSIAFWIYTDIPSLINMLFWAGDNITGGGFGPENEMHVHLEQPVTEFFIGGECSFWLKGNPDMVHLFSDPEKYALGQGAGVPPVNPILVSDMQWHHIAVSWGRGFAKLYVDGDYVVGDNYASSSYSLSNIKLGQAASGVRSYTGKLDDVKIYSRVLNGFEISNLYNNVDSSVICTKTITNDTIIHFVSNIEYEASSPKIYLESIDSLKTISGSCDSIVRHYTKYTFLPNHCTDTNWINDTNIVTVYDSIAVTDTLIIDVTITNIDESEFLNSIQVYPNPTKDILYIHSGNSYEQMVNYRLKIVNELGSVIFESFVNQPIFEIDISTFGQTGLYFIQLIDDSSQRIENRKLLLK